MARFLLILLVLLPFFAVPASAVQVYRWTDSDGNVQFSDKPPPGGAENVERTEVYVAPGESGQLPVTAGTNDIGNRAGGGDVLVVGEGSDNPNTGASSPGGSSGGAPGGGGGAAGGGNSGGGAPGGGDGTGGDGADYASSEGSNPAPAGEGQGTPADGAGADAGTAPGGPGAAAAATDSASGPGGTGAATASTGSGARRTADPDADNPIPPGAIPGAPVATPRGSTGGSSPGPGDTESVTATTRTLPPAPAPVAEPVAEPAPAPRPRPAPRRRADIPPCLPGPVPLQRPLVDKYAEWEFSPHWYFGNRMNNAADINADAVDSGFPFDGAPYHEIVPSESATQFNFFEGEKALPLSAQIRFRFPILTPDTTRTATFVWEAKYDPVFFTGNKAFQISYDKNIHIEHNPISDLEDPNNPTWLMVPATRTYGDPLVGGNGEKAALSSGEWAQRNVQPALDAPGRRYPYCYARDHVTGTQPRAFLVKPGQWYRYIYTIDWRSEPHRLWLWIESEDTPRTLLLADETDSSKGFILQFSDARPGVDSFWFEFNNSSTLNPVDFYVRVRNFFILRNVLGGDL